MLVDAKRVTIMVDIEVMVEFEMDDDISTTQIAYHSRSV